MNQLPENTLSKAKIEILTKSVFFSTLLFSLETVLTEKVSTAATDGKEILINPKFIEHLTKPQLIGLMLHEVMHVALDSFGRKGTRDHRKWNIATDYAINIMLHDEKYELPDGGLLSEEYRDMTAESIYDALPESDEEQSWGAGDILEPVDKIEASQRAKEILVQAQTACDIKDCGNEVPGAIRARINKLLNPILPWNIILQNYMQDFAKEDHSWTRPNRRYMPDFYLPSQHSPTIKHIVVAIDTSGSVSEGEMKTYLTEVEQIRSMYSLERLTIYGVSTCIDNKFEIEPSDILTDLKFGSHGGTHFKSFFNQLAKEPPTVLIFFSDLFVDFDFKVPMYDVIWISTDGEEAPSRYGRTVQLKH